MRHLKVPLFLIASLLFAAALAPSPATGAQAIEERIVEVDLAGDFLYVNVQVYEGNYYVDGGLRVYDVSDASSPVQVGSLSTPFIARIVVEGDFAYLGTRYTMSIVDVSDPANPILVDDSVPLDWGNRLAARGRYVYTLHDKVVSIYHVDDDGHPQLVSSSPLPLDSVAAAPGPSAVEGEVYHSVWVLDWPYLYPYASGVKIDVSDPANPVAAGEYQFPVTNSSEAWAVRDGVFYTVDFEPYMSDVYELVVADVGGAWTRVFLGGPIDPGPGVEDYEMAWDRYLAVAADLSFTIYDFGEFSFANGTGDAPIVYQNTSMVYSNSVVDASYYEGQGVFYLARGEGGLDVLQAPFPTPTLDHDVYFPLSAR